MIKPLPNRILIEPILLGERQASEIAAKIPGFEMPKPKYQGVPNTGTVRAVGKDIVGNINVDDVVVFNEPKPHGFKYEGMTLFALVEDQIEAVL